jgi:hypothetical protein
VEALGDLAAHTHLLVLQSAQGELDPDLRRGTRLDARPEPTTRHHGHDARRPSGSPRDRPGRELDELGRREGHVVHVEQGLGQDARDGRVQGRDGDPVRHLPHAAGGRDPTPPQGGEHDHDVDRVGSEATAERAAADALGGIGVRGGHQQRRAHPEQAEDSCGREQEGSAVVALGCPRGGHRRPVLFDLPTARDRTRGVRHDHTGVR